MHHQTRMGSLYITIAIPSAEYEKSLWIEKNLCTKSKIDLGTIRPNKSACDTGDHWRSPWEETDRVKMSRSVSDDSVFVLDKSLDTPDLKQRAHSALYVSKMKTRMPMEKRLEKCLKELKIPNAVWVLGRAGQYYQVSFCTAAGEQCENIMQLFSEHKIGEELNSTVSILPCSLYYEGKENSVASNKASPTMHPDPQQYLSSAGFRERTAWELFVHSVRARLMVAQVVAGVKSNALLTFDFVILLTIASMTAAVGLVENSLVVLVASMLISPLMGPVMASTFGFVIRDWRLQKIGVLNELLGLLLCVLIGFVSGLAIGFLRWESSDTVWPTPEMLSRGDLRSLWVGALIALFSGTAVSIAVLGNYSGSLTGVAISASLMPPAVNAGLVWALAVVTVVMGDTEFRTLTAFTDGHPVTELLILGFLSLALTFINIVCIFLTGILVLKIKEVSPRGSKDYSKLLWKETIQIARDYLPQNPETLGHGVATDQFSNLFTHHPYKMGLHQYTWSAYGAVPDLSQPTVQDLASAWHHLTLNPPTTSQPSQSNTRPVYRVSPHPHLQRLWTSVMSSPGAVDSYDSVQSTPFGTRPPHPPHSQRFTVTPSKVDFNV